MSITLLSRCLRFWIKWNKFTIVWVELLSCAFRASVLGNFRNLLLPFHHKLHSHIFVEWLQWFYSFWECLSLTKLLLFITIKLDRLFCVSFAKHIDNGAIFGSLSGVNCLDKVNNLPGFWKFEHSWGSLFWGDDLVFYIKAVFKSTYFAWVGVLFFFELMKRVNMWTEIRRLNYWFVSVKFRKNR